MKKNIIKKQEYVMEVISLLKKHYPDAKCELNFQSPFQLLVATILSAQCTDERVNKVTAVLFEKYPDVKSMGKLKQEELEILIKSTGFFRSKAKSILQTCKIINEEFGGKVPETMEELLTLRGVARKTANVVLWNSFGKAVGIVVDTHVMRLSKRFGLVDGKLADAKVIEKNLMELVPEQEWGMFSHYLIFHGRRVCKARNPNCAGCFLNKICPSVFKT